MRTDKGVTASIPESKTLSLTTRSADILHKSTITLRELRSYAGAVSFVAGIIPHLRPFLAACWAAIAACGRRPSNDLQPRAQLTSAAKKRRLPGNMIYVKQVHHALTWIKAFFDGTEGSIIRAFELSPVESPFSIATDASPWGLGGVLFHNGNPVEYFCDIISTEDFRRFHGQLGESGLTTLWEMLALLVALRIWFHHLAAEPAIMVRADSLGALRVALKMSSPDPRINAIARELALDTSTSTHQFKIFEHIPGFSNYLPDCLSRLAAPADNRKNFPKELSSIPQARLPARDAEFWRTWSSPGKRT